MAKPFLFNPLPLEGGGPEGRGLASPQCDLLPREGGGPLAVEVGLPRNGRRQTVRHQTLAYLLPHYREPFTV